MARRSDPGFKVIVSLTDKFTGPIKGVNRQIAQSTAKLRGIMAVPGAIMREAGIGKIGAAFGNIGTQFGRLRSSITGLLGPFARIGAIIGGISLGKMVTDAITAGGELIKLSQSSGIAVEELQKLHYAAKQSGVSAESMDGALVKLNKSIIDAIKGGKQTTKAFQAAGISMDDLRKLSTDEIFRKLASAVADTTNDSHKQALAFTLLGKSGTELIPVLNEGAWGVRALGDELESTGALMSRDTAQAAKEFGDIMLRLSHHVQGVAYSVLKELLPGMKGGATAMDEWIKVNKEWITTSVVGVVRDLVEMGAAFAAIVRNDIMPAIQSFRPVWDGVVAILGEGNTLLLAFTAVVAPGVIGALLGITKAVIGLGVALVANPIGAAIVAIVAAIAGVAYLIWRHWDSIVGAFTWAWDEIKSLFADWSPVEAVSTAVREIADAVTRWLGPIVQAVGDIMRDAGEAITGALSALIEFVASTMREIIAAISGAAAGVRDAIVSALTSPIDFVKEQWNALVAWLTGVFEKISGVFGSAARLVGLGGPAAGAATGPDGAAVPVVPSTGYQSPSQRRAALMAERSAAGPAALAESAQTTSKSEVTVSFENMPEGTRVRETRNTGNTDLNLNTAYAGRRGALAEAY